ncbi:MAG: hypothetical protein AAFR93_02985 [Pseudomonadota bacterium]
MTLTELTAPDAAAFPVRALAEHLRLGSGFADDGSLDALLEGYLLAAIVTVEGRIGRAILTRDFLWEVTAWRATDRQALPLAGVSAIVSVLVQDAQGVETTVDAQSYGLVADSQCPSLEGRPALPAIPAGGVAVVRLRAGFGTTWDAVPGDLGHAILMLAAHFFEHRASEGGRPSELPIGVLAMIARYRRVRLGGGSV